MSTIEPPDPDEIFQSIVSDLNLETPNKDADFSSMETTDLIRRSVELRHELFKIGEIPHARTPEGREMQSELSSILFILKKRNVF